MAVNSDTLYDLENIVKINITQYLSDYSDFIDNDYSNYVSFYKGELDNVPLTSQNKYNKLVLDGESINNTITQLLNLLNRSDFCDSVELLDSVFYSLGTISKLSRFLKSSRINITDTGRVSVVKNVTAADTPEKMHSDSENSQNDWVDTYVKNRIFELDYDSDNGYSITKELSSYENFDVNTVIDNLVGDKLYGKDIDLIFAFTEDKSDIVTLGYKETINQTFKTAIQLMRGDNPFYPTLGIDPEMAFGNLVGTNIPFIISDVNGVVGSDDCFQNFQIESIQPEGNTLQLTFSASTLLNENLKNSKTI